MLIRRLVIGLGAAVVAAALFGSAGGQTRIGESDLATENAALRAKVAQLESKIRQLERELAFERARARRHALPFIRPYFGEPVPRLWPMPPGSVPRQFNGFTYYIVPLEQGAVTADR